MEIDAHLTFLQRCEQHASATRHFVGKPRPSQTSRRRASQRSSMSPKDEAAILAQFREELTKEDLLHEGDSMGTDDETLLYVS